jgi:hypothetical protein
MLKIKDNVDLKELEKYGYKEAIVYPLGNAMIKTLEYDDFIFIKDDYIGFEINDFCGSDYEKYCEELVNDLIKDGLVEKVED